MPWFKVDDGFATSDKVTAIPRKDRLLAIGLWTYAGNYSARVLNDGLVPVHMLEDIDAPQEMIDHLIRVGLWDRDELGQIWFHDWCEYQPSAEEHRERQKAIKEKRSEAGKQGATKRWDKQADSKPIANGMAKEWQNDSKPMANEWQKDSPEPEPEPEPEPSIPNGIDNSPENSFDGMFNKFWETYPRKENKQSARRSLKLALKVETLETIIAGALQYGQDPNRDPAFTKHAATWLNNQCWNDDPLPAKNRIDTKLANQQSAREAFLNATTNQPAITSEPDWAINE